MSEDVSDIDAIVANAKNRIRSRGEGGSLPQMSPRDILGADTSSVAARAYENYEEMDAAQNRRDLPAVEENVKTLGDLMARYRIGEDPDFRVLIYRLWPKTFPGGILAEGYYATYDQPITEQTVAEEFGGGHYRVAIHGPRPGDTHRTKHYASLVVKIAGEPRTDKIPNKGSGAVPMMPNPAAAGTPLESESLVNRAFTTLHKFAQDEREERRLLEQQRFTANEASRDTIDTIKSVFERTSRELIDAERAAAERERQLHEERMREREERLMALERRYEDERRTAPDPMDTLQRAASLFRNDGESQQRVLDAVLQKHHAEITMMREEHSRTIDRIREASIQEASAIREAARREVEAERNAWVSRERDLLRQVETVREASAQESVASREVARREVETERNAAANRERDLLRQIEHEREERRRDADRYRDELATREQAAKDRLDQMKETLTMRFEAQYESFKQQVDMRDKYLQDELSRKTRELDDLKGSVREERDPIVQMRRMNEFRETAKDILGFSTDYSPPSVPSSGGIGSASSSSGFDLNKVLESVVERGPQYLEAIGRIVQGGGGGTPAAGAAAPPQPGQILNLPQGTFQVVQTAQGLGMVPFNPAAPPAATMVPERLPAPPRQRPRALPEQRRPQVMPDVDDVFEQESRAAQPRAQAAPSRRPPQTPAADAPAAKPPRPARSAPKQRASAAPQAAPAPKQAAPAALPAQNAEPAPAQERLPEAIEKQAAEMIEGILGNAIMGGDEPEDVIQQISGKFPEDWLKILANYDMTVIFERIREARPNSAVLTPGGVTFTRDTFKQLRAVL